MISNERATLINHLEDVTAILGEVTSKNMFGANGFCTNGKVFCMVTKDSKIVFKFNNQELYDRMKEDFEASQWSPRQGRSFGFWIEMPTAFITNDKVLIEWASLAHGSI